MSEAGGVMPRGGGMIYETAEAVNEQQQGAAQTVSGLNWFEMDFLRCISGELHGKSPVRPNARFYIFHVTVFRFTSQHRA